MLRTKLTLSSALFISIFAGLASAAPTPGTVPVTQLTPSLKQERVPFRVIWRAQAHEDDYFASNSFGEVTPYQSIEQLFYIPANQGAENQRAPLFRLYDGSIRRHHTESLEGAVEGYRTEGVLGYGWREANAPEGTEVIFRLHNEINGDYAIANEQALIADYTEKEIFTDVFAYPRPSSNTKTIECVYGEALRLCSNLRSGGAIWDLLWNKKNLVDRRNYTRLIQSSVSGIDQTKATLAEGGSSANINTRQFKAWNGSPVLLSNTDNGNKTQTTLAVPLERNLRAFGESGAIYPNWRIGKTVTLDSQDLDLGEGFESLAAQVIVYDTIVESPLDLSTGQSQPVVEMPAGYFPNCEDCDNRFYKINAESEEFYDGTTELFDSDFQATNTVDGYEYEFPAAGGVAIATSTLKNAIGVYSRRSQEGEPGVRYGSLQQLTYTGKWSMIYSGPLSKGRNKFRSYVVVGTLQDVHRIMHRLFIMGY